MTEKEINRIECSTRERKRFYALFIVEPTAKIAPGAALLRRPALCRPKQADPAATLRNPSMQVPICDYPSHSDFR
jgi:hypothetical protein